MTGLVARFAAWMTVCWLVLGATITPALSGGWLTVAGLAVLSAAPMIALARAFRGESYPSAATRLFVFRPFWYVQLALPLLAGSAIVGAVAGLPWGASERTAKGAVAIAAAIIAVALLGGYVGTRRLVVRRLDVLLPGLPPALDGLRVAQVSDLHVGPHTSRRFLACIAKALSDARPDLIAITGDQVDDHAADVEHFARAFEMLAAPLGVFVVPGNHDVYAGWEGVRDGIERIGMKILVNQAVPRERNGQRFWIAGTGDPAGRRSTPNEGAPAPHVERTLARIPAGEVTIALAHNPALWPELAKRAVTLTLSGHTHHGQLSVPWLKWSLASQFLDYAMGMYERDGSLLYVSPGTGYWGIPFRIGALPEVSVLTLRSSGRGPSRIVPATDDRERE